MISLLAWDYTNLRNKILQLGAIFQYSDVGIPLLKLREAWAGGMGGINNLFFLTDMPFAELTFNLFSNAISLLWCPLRKMENVDYYIWTLM